MMHWENNLNNYEQKSVAATFTLQLMRLKAIAPDAHRLLTMLAFFDPESIPIDILTLGATSIMERLADHATSSLNVAVTFLPEQKLSTIGRLVTKLKAKRQVGYVGNNITPMGHPDTLTTVNNLAGILEKQRKYNKAESMYRRALAGQRTQLGADHPSTMTTVNNLAHLFKSQGKYGEAETMYGQALAAREERLGADHPDTLMTIYCMARLYHKQDRLEQAKTLYTRALIGQNIKLGLSHPDTIITKKMA